MIRQYDVSAAMHGVQHVVVQHLPGEVQVGGYSFQYRRARAGTERDSFHVTV